MSDSLRAFMASLTSWLDAAAVPYMVAGSFASTLHGRPRSTQDVDIVIDPTDADEKMITSTNHVLNDRRPEFYFGAPGEFSADPSR